MGRRFHAGNAYDCVHFVRVVFKRYPNEVRIRLLDAYSQWKVVASLACCMVYRVLCQTWREHWLNLICCDGYLMAVPYSSNGLSEDMGRPTLTRLSLSGEHPFEEITGERGEQAVDITQYVKGCSTENPLCSFPGDIHVSGSSQHRGDMQPRRHYDIRSQSGLLGVVYVCYNSYNSTQLESVLTAAHINNLVVVRVDKMTSSVRPG